MSDELAKLVSCQQCDLAKTRIQVVVGSGDEQADVLFLGEAPGRNEDEGGKPFIGAGGALLDEFLGHAQLKRSEIYITNIVKCRPPKNRNPLRVEILACEHWLEAQLRAVAPRVVVTLGAYATGWMTGSSAPMKELVGVHVRVTKGRQTFVVIPMYHPAATLYNRTLRTPFLEGAQIVRDTLDALDKEGR